MGSKTNPELFIIESLTLQDEKKGRHEGDIISKILHLVGKRKTRYYYIRTLRELKKIVKIFGKSRHRYLHISCHANESGIDTTFDTVSYAELARILRPHLRGRRVFVSACQMANHCLAGKLFKNSGLFSLIGPRDDIYFDDSAAFWVSLYHLMFNTDYKRMTRQNLRNRIRQLSEVYDIQINYFTADKKYSGFTLLLTSNL